MTLGSCSRDGKECTELVYVDDMLMSGRHKESIGTVHGQARTRAVVPRDGDSGPHHYGRHRAQAAQSESGRRHSALKDVTRDSMMPAVEDIASKGDGGSSATTGCLCRCCWR